MPDMPMDHRAGDGVARRRRQSRSERLRALIPPSRWGAARPRREKKRTLTDFFLTWQDLRTESSIHGREVVVGEAAAALWTTRDDFCNG